MAKVVVLLSPTQRAKLLQIPDTFSERDITRHYSLSAEDLAVIEQHRRPQNRLGFTVQLAYCQRRRKFGSSWFLVNRREPSLICSSQAGPRPLGVV
jgi:TnpA family transposase